MKKMLWLLVAFLLFSSACSSTPAVVDTGEVAINLDKLAVQEVVPLPGVEEKVFGDLKNLSLSPDGTKFAIVNARYLTVYATDGTQLAQYENPAGIDSRGMTWSPNSKKIAFTENFWVYFRNSDLYVMDVASGAVTNLTRDGVQADVLKAPEGTPFDSDPEWLGNETIIFYRVIRKDGSLHYTLQGIPAAGGSPTELYDMTEFGNTDYPAFMVSHKQDKLVFQQGSGVWTLDLKSKTASKLFNVDLAWAIIGISQDDKYVMLLNRKSSIMQDASFYILPLDDPAELLRLETGDDDYVVVAGWLPSGSAYAYIQNSIEVAEGKDSWQLFVVKAPGEVGNKIYGQGGDFRLFSLNELSYLNWARNNQFVLFDPMQKKPVLIKMTDK